MTAIADRLGVLSVARDLVEMGREAELQVDAAKQKRDRR